MIEPSVIKDERRSEYHCYEEPPDNPLPKEWNKNPEVNPLIRLFNNPWITMNDLIDSQAFEMFYSEYLSFEKKLYLLENLKVENGILLPEWWKSNPEDFADLFNEEYRCIERQSILSIPPHKKPYLALEIFFTMSGAALELSIEPNDGLWNLFSPKQK